MITETNPNLVPSLRVAVPSPQVKRRGGGRVRLHVGYLVPIVFSRFKQTACFNFELSLANMMLIFVLISNFDYNVFGFSIFCWKLL